MSARRRMLVGAALGLVLVGGEGCREPDLVVTVLFSNRAVDAGAADSSPPREGGANDGGVDQGGTPDLTPPTRCTGAQSDNRLMACAGKPECPDVRSKCSSETNIERERTEVAVELSQSDLPLYLSFSTCCKGAPSVVRQLPIDFSEDRDHAKPFRITVSVSCNGIVEHHNCPGVCGKPETCHP